MPRSPNTLALLAAAASLLAPRLAEARFERQELQVPGQILWIDWGDLDGDQLVDLVVSYVRGTGPQAERQIAIFFRAPQGLPREPSLRLTPPAQTAIFDVGDLLPGRPGDELVYLSRYGVYAQSLAGRRAETPVQVLRERSVVGVPEEEDLVRWDLVRRLSSDPSEPPALVFPTAASLDVYQRDAGGELKRTSRVSLDSFAYYDAESLVYKQGRRGGGGNRPFSLRITTIVPTLTFIDQSGDGRADLVATYQDRVAVHLRKPDGTFTSSASHARWLAFLTPEEQAARDVEMTVDVVDLDDDGIADLSANKVGGGLTNIRSETRLYRGRRGGGFEDRPAQTFKEGGFATLISYVDVDGDGRTEMLHPFVEVTVIGMSKMLISQKLGIDLRVRRRGAGTPFSSDVAQTLEMTFGLDYTTGGALRGAAPLFGHDFDGDGRRDVILTTGAEQLSMYRGRAGSEPFDDDGAIVLSGPVSRETHALPQRVGAKSPVDVLVAFVDVPKLAGRLVLFHNRFGR
jgi:hypothetical protein